MTIPTSKVKPKTLFDHISHIRSIKSTDYMESLTEEEKKSFVKYVILIGLSMDDECIDNMAIVSKYFDILPNESFYKVCCDLTPKSKSYFKWIKPNRQKVTKELSDLIAAHFQIGKREATNQCIELFKTNEGLLEIVEICSMYGKSEDEIEKLLEPK